ncbi:hypothetical protein CIG11343_0795 [Campylobacter iguaniorum]|uniref:hypothetical protein n=1 Tax=Campylobacter iguaniorum TaxID=1244531 RepID=UPI0007C88F6D|nr:hypothetical protein [Campylobacter iguaniorum]ANE35832.1 hypothetical protein CIG11343_0795 [Campylobacter iguaniorum]
MDKKEVAKYIGKDIKTLYNWEKTNKNLYKIIETFFQKNNEINPKIKELNEYFLKLSDKEQDFYISDIKTRLLKKEIE